MLRATCEIAVAISVNSLDEKRRVAASARAFCRATRTSTSAATDTKISAAIPRPFAPLAIRQQRKRFLKVERGRGPGQPQPELRHRKGNLRLNAGDDRGGAEEMRHLRDTPQGAGGVRIHDVEQRHITDDAGR